MREFTVTLVKEAPRTTDRGVYGRASVREVLRREFRVDAETRDEATKMVLDVMRATDRAWLAVNVEVEEARD